MIISIETCKISRTKVGIRFVKVADDSWSLWQLVCPRMNVDENMKGIVVKTHGHRL